MTHAHAQPRRTLRSVASLAAEALAAVGIVAGGMVLIGFATLL